MPSEQKTKVSPGSPMTKTAEMSLSNHGFLPPAEIRRGLHLHKGQTQGIQPTPNRPPYRHHTGPASQAQPGQAPVSPTTEELTPILNNKSTSRRGGGGVSALSEASAELRGTAGKTILQTGKDYSDVLHNILQPRVLFFKGYYRSAIFSTERAKYTQGTKQNLQ